MLRKRIPPKPDRSAEFASFEPRPRAVAVSDGKARMSVPAPKAPKRIESEPYRRLVAALPCINCGVVGASQAAHPNAGKAKSRKADDTLCFPLCHVGANDCHGMFDRYELGGRTLQARLEPMYAQQTQQTLVTNAVTGGDRYARRVLESLGMIRKSVKI